MYGFGSDATSSAGQRTSESPDFAPSQSPRQSLFVTLHLPPGSLEFLPESGDDNREGEDETGERASLEDSAEDDIDSSSIEEVYDNGAKKFFYMSDEKWNTVDPNEYDSQIAYQSFKYDEENDSQIAGQFIDDDENQSDDSDAHGASATQAESRENLVDSPTSKLLASCLDTDQPFLYDYLAQRSALAVAFLESNHNILEQFLTRHPDFVLQFLRRNQQQARTLFIEDPTWYVEQHLDKSPYLLENYLMEHPESVEKFISGNPKYFDRYLIRHPEFAINYLHYNRLPSGFGIPPDMFGVTCAAMTPPPGVQTPSPTSAGLPSPDSSPPPPPPPPLQPVDEPGRKSTSRKSQATKKPPTKPARHSQQVLPKAAPAEAGPNKKQQLPRSGVAPVSAPVPSLAEAPITLDSGPKKTTGPSHTKSTAAPATASSSNDSSQSRTYKVLLTSAYGQIAGQFMSYPAPADLLAASRKQDAGTKGSWRLFEEDRAIKHMLDVRDEVRLAGETRFEEVSTRLKAEGIERGFFAVKNYWNRTGRARSGFDERKNKTAPLATSKQGKAFRPKKKSKAERKKRRGKGVKVDSEVEEDEEEEEERDDSEYSVHSEEEDTPPPPQLLPPPSPPSPPPPPVSAPAPTGQKSALKRPADHDDEALAWAMSRGTRPKKQRTG